MIRATSTTSSLEVKHYMRDGIKLSDSDLVRSLAMYVGTNALKFIHLVPEGIQRERLNGLLGEMIEPAKKWNKGDISCTQQEFNSKYVITREKMCHLRDYINTSAYYIVVDDELCKDEFNCIRNVHWMVIKKTDSRITAIAGDKIQSLIQQSDTVEIKFNAVSQYVWNLVNQYCTSDPDSSCCIQ